METTFRAFLTRKRLSDIEPAICIGVHGIKQPVLVSQMEWSLGKWLGE